MRSQFLTGRSLSVAIIALTVGRCSAVLVLGRGRVPTAAIDAQARLSAPEPALGRTAADVSGHKDALRHGPVAHGDADAKTGRDLVVVENCGNFRVDNVHIKNAGRYGLRLAGVVQGEFDNVECFNSRSGGVVVEPTALEKGGQSTTLCMNGVYVSGTAAGHGF